jgi:peptide/nickel transport system substrate-binding protein
MCPNRLIGLMLVALLVSCAPSPEPASGSLPQPAIPVQSQSRTVVLAHRHDPPTLAPKVAASSTANTTRIFNAALTLIDAQGAPRPYLAEAVPQLDTDAWRVFPDGRMETTYRLREGLTWHDGAPLVAEDFAFALRVYKDASLGAFLRTPQNDIDGLLAPDPRTIVIQWRSPNPIAGSLTLGDLDPLPAHVLNGPYTDFLEGRSSDERFLADPFWTSEYVGAGPYKLERWERGVQIEATAFNGHVLGRPKIERLVVRIATDENTLLAAVLAGGQVDYTASATLRFEHLLVLKREWEAAGKGVAVAVPGPAIFLNLQQRPEYVGDPALLDLRVRRALAHTLDRAALNEGVFDGYGIPTETILPRTVPFYPEHERLITRYPLDANRARQLMSDAGYTRDAEGFFVNPQGRRVRVDFATQRSPEIERMAAIQSDIWRRDGFDVYPIAMNPELFARLEVRHTLPGLGYAQGPAEVSFTMAEIGTEANRWAGLNRTGWTHPEYERLWNSMKASLDPVQRGANVAQMMALVTEHLPGYPLYFVLTARTRVAGLQGPTDETEAVGFGSTSRETTSYWNIQDWTLR